MPRFRPLESPQTKPSTSFSPAPINPPSLPPTAQAIYPSHPPPPLLTMRPLTEPETKTLFTKLANYTGPSIKNLIAPPDSGPTTTRMVFRLGSQNRAYYCSEHLANLATSVARENLLSVGTCLGVFVFVRCCVPSFDRCCLFPPYSYSYS